MYTNSADMRLAASKAASGKITPEQFDALKPGQRIWIAVTTPLIRSKGEVEYEVGRASYSQKYDIHSKTLYRVDEDGTVQKGKSPWVLLKRPTGVSLSHGDMATRIESFRVASTNQRVAVDLPSEEDGGKASHDEDFKAGFKAGQAALKKNKDTSASDAQKAYKAVSSKHGSWWVDGFTAALDLERGASNTKPAQVAKKMKLASSMDFANEVREAELAVLQFKQDKVHKILQHVTIILRSLGWELKSEPVIDLLPRRGFLEVILRVDTPNSMSTSDIEKVVQRNLGYGWLVLQKPLSVELQFEYPTP